LLILQIIFYWIVRIAFPRGEDWSGGDSGPFSWSWLINCKEINNSYHASTDSIICRQLLYSFF